MKTRLYVARGEYRSHDMKSMEGSDEVCLSQKPFEIEESRNDEDVAQGLTDSWPVLKGRSRAPVEEFCHRGFKKITGIDVPPGHQVCLEIQEVPW